ncbi:MAG: DUF6427 family protein [Flavobacteriaceae bacterium]|nr:DUF6427 family protein [Flavobacteriaceae bacterium]
MISSFFKKTKPINFVIILLGWSISFWGLLFWNQKMHFSDMPILQWVYSFFGVAASIFLLDKLITQFKITLQHHYAIFLFWLLVNWLPELFHKPHIIWANLFVLMGLRYAFLLKNLKYLKIYIFNASIFIAIASLFHHWSLLYLVLVYVSVWFYCPTSFKHWIIPLVGVATVGVLAYQFLIFFGDLGFFQNHFQYRWVWDWSIVQNKAFIALHVLLAISGIWFMIRSEKLGSERQIIIWIFFYQILLSAISTLNNYEIENLYYGLVPLSILLSLAMEAMTKAWMRELSLWLVLFTPLLLML